MSTEIFQPHQRPTRMTKVELLQLLAWTRELIENDDSMEGAITYGWSDEPGVYDVHAFLRTGNSMGQGGVTILQAPDPVPDAAMASGLADTEPRYIERDWGQRRPNGVPVRWHVYRTGGYAKPPNSVEGDRLIVHGPDIDGEPGTGTLVDFPVLP